MWIFLTAVFLVLFFLFYRHPKAMLKVTGVLVALVALIGLGAYYWNLPIAQQQALQEADMARWRESVAEQERQRQQAEAEREQQRERAEAEKERIKRQAEVRLGARRTLALRGVTPIATELKCLLSFACSNYRLTVTVANRSEETISHVSLGWVFLPANQGTCPSTLPTRRTEDLVLRPGATTVFSWDDWDGPRDGGYRYCVLVTDVKLAQ